MVRGHPNKGMYWLTSKLAVPSSVNYSGGDREHICPATEAIGEHQDVGVVSWRDRKGAEVVNTDGDTWTFR